MFSRYLAFALLQIVGAVAGWTAGTVWRGHSDFSHAWTAWGACGALAGVLLASWLGFVVDAQRARRVLAWLRNDELSAADAPAVRGLWGEAGDRARRRARRGELLAQEGRARADDILAALQVSPNGVMLLDEQGRIEWCNQIAADHFGIDVERDRLQSIGNLVRDPAFATYWSGRDFGHDIQMPGRRHTPGRPFTLSVKLNPYGTGRTLLLSRDVTAMEQADAMRRDFVANVSHEIRTPLTVLTGFVETLQTLPLDEGERHHYLGLMAQQAGRMQNVVNDLLTLSRLEGSPPPGRAEWVPVQALLAHCEQEGRALSELLGRRHVLEFPSAAQMAAAGALAGSQHELQSAMSNLVGNAVRYTPAGGTIRIRWTLLDGGDPVRGSAGEGEFVVEDTGPGIAPEHIPRLTERFYRVDRSRSRETGGTGLGLAIVKHVLQRHGGRLLIDSVPGVGSRFALVFPASRVRADNAAAAGKAAPLAAPA
ncbi:phosphate regulon sensor histidine kinase PhoR [uncultured Xylophilus sp.]|uniref:phosphate regulon sensor histidine kinase PhoR n=1 Tax=uncultured Xylophilus sp. TaxID=296832 RepID=UPI0025F18CA1|nr:phosphate regulon sensor histidine kinase PhoR [uncultured Xylophilus sp.]